MISARLQLAAHWGCSKCPETGWGHKYRGPQRTGGRVPTRTELRVLRPYGCSSPRHKPTTPVLILNFHGMELKGLMSVQKPSWRISFPAASHNPASFVPAPLAEENCNTTFTLI